MTSVRKPVSISITLHFHSTPPSPSVSGLDILHKWDPIIVIGLFLTSFQNGDLLLGSLPSPVGRQPPLERLLLRGAAVAWLCHRTLSALLRDCKEPRVGPRKLGPEVSEPGNPGIKGFRHPEEWNSCGPTATPRTG